LRLEFQPFHVRSFVSSAPVAADALVLQGDQRERLPKILSSRGVKKITRG
jgi:translation initiation factor 1 (eIF-1/SUI1)